MSAYIKLSTLEYPLHEGDIRIEHPEIQESQTGITFPCPSTYALVQPVDPPEVLFSNKQYVVELPPVATEFGWQMQFEVRTYTDEEYAQEIATRESLSGQYLNKHLNYAGSDPDVIG